MPIRTFEGSYKTVLGVSSGAVELELWSPKASYAHADTPATADSTTCSERWQDALAARLARLMRSIIARVPLQCQQCDDAMLAALIGNEGTRARYMYVILQYLHTGANA